MKKIICAVLMNCLMFSTVAVAEQVAIIGNKNCAIFGSKKWEEKTIKITLQPGRYTIKPFSGAVSPYPKDDSAKKVGEKPWMFYVKVDVDEKEYVIGRLIKFDTKEEALKENEDDAISIELNKETTIKIGTEDISEGKDYCNDNRGTEIIDIQKYK